MYFNFNLQRWNCFNLWHFNYKNRRVILDLEVRFTGFWHDLSKCINFRHLAIFKLAMRSAVSLNVVFNIYIIVKFSSPLIKDTVKYEDCDFISLKNCKKNKKIVMKQNPWTWVQTINIRGKKLKIKIPNIAVTMVRWWESLHITFGNIVKIIQPDGYNPKTLLSCVVVSGTCSNITFTMTSPPYDREFSRTYGEFSRRTKNS